MGDMNDVDIVMSPGMELIKRNKMTSIVLKEIEDALGISVAFVSDYSCLSDFTIGLSDKDKSHVVSRISQMLGIAISNDDSIIDIVDSFMLMSNPKNSN